MSDEADRSDERIEAAIQEGIRKSRAGKSLAWTGECYWCGNELPEPLRFCDSDCRDDFERLEQANRRAGR